VHSLRTLFADLATFARLDVTMASDTNHVFTLYTRPTPLQSRAFDLLGINPERTQKRHPSRNEYAARSGGYVPRHLEVQTKMSAPLQIFGCWQ
jgi:hypothetical protein